ncbi:MAG: hypothetical protein A3A86_07485 [Elusimicrobia bacterium RIFCSPLOWO2_01_FULL_60_11]|nr:MAG: hypothetical protein A3A86_07485 [Elusimicrobia bacterium RIFCSPLOWO2_01_FULL_60_11]
MKNRKASFAVRFLAGTLVFATTLAITQPPKGWAMLAPAEVTSAGDISAMRAADIKTVQSALESKIVRQRLIELKLSPDEINGRLTQLSDAQVHQLASQIRAVNPGGDGGIGIIIGLLVIAILVVFFIYIFKRV